MVALVDVPAGLGRQRIDGVELEHGDAGILQALEERLRRAQRADRVVDHVDLHALGLLGQQGIRETPSGFVVLEDVGLHVDVVARAGDRRQHRGICAGAVLEQHDAVAEAERAARDLLLERQVPRQAVRVLIGAGQAGQDFLAAFRRKDSSAGRLELDAAGIGARHVGRDDRQRAAAGDNGERKRRQGSQERIEVWKCHVAALAELAASARAARVTSSGPL